LTGLLKIVSTIAFSFGSEALGVVFPTSVYFCTLL